MDGWIDGLMDGWMDGWMEMFDIIFSKQPSKNSMFIYLAYNTDEIISFLTYSF